MCHIPSISIFVEFCTMCTQYILLKSGLIFNVDIWHLSEENFEMFSFNFRKILVPKFNTNLIVFGGISHVKVEGHIRCHYLYCVRKIRCLLDKTLCHISSVSMSTLHFDTMYICGHQQTTFKKQLCERHSGNFKEKSSINHIWRIWDILDFYWPKLK